MNNRPFWWPDARGWIGIGVFAMSVLLLLLMYSSREFRADEFVQTVATLVIGTGFVGGVVAWAYAATKTGGELADHNARIVRDAAAPVKVEPPATITETKTTTVEQTAPPPPAIDTPEAAPWEK